MKPYRSTSCEIELCVAAGLLLHLLLVHSNADSRGDLQLG